MPQLKVWTNATPKELKGSVGVVVKRNAVNNQVIKITPDLPKVGPGDVVLAMGNKAVEVLQEHGLVPKNRKVGSLRGKLIPYNGGHILPTFDPRLVERDYTCQPQIEWDTTLAIRQVVNGHIHPVLGDYKWVKDFTKVINYVEKEYARTGKKVSVSCDLETLGLVSYNPAAFIVSIFFTPKVGKSHGVRFQGLQDQPQQTDLLHQQIFWLLNSEKVKIVGANFKYDTTWMIVKWGIVCTNFTFDTTLVGSLLDENRSNSLNMHAKIYTPMGGYDDPFNAKYDKGRMDLIPDSDMLIYAGGDTDACLRVSDRMRTDLLKDKALANFYVKLLHPSCRAFELVEQEGLLLDIDYYTELKKEVEDDIKRLEGEAIECMPMVIRNKYAGTEKNNKKEIVPKLRLSKTAIIQEFMFGPKGLGLKPQMWTDAANKRKKSDKGYKYVLKDASTSLDHLRMFSGNPKAGPFIAVLEQYGSAKKTLSTYIDGFLAHLRPDGRFHPSYMIYRGDYGGDDAGTVTGRTSAKDPAVQCLKGDTQVLTDRGHLPIQKIVEGYEAEEIYRVLTHTGKWRRVVGVYRNGVRGVFSVLSEHGRMVVSTENHPYLTKRGWVRTDQLQPGDNCYELRSQDAKVHITNLPQLDRHEESLQQSNQQGLPEVRESGYQGLRAVAELQELSGGHGGEAQEGHVHRETECGRGLRAGELHLGHPETASQQPEQHQADYPQRQDNDRGTVGEGGRYFTRETSLQALQGASDGVSLDEGEAVELGVFTEGIITSVEPAGECETFDLTIEGSHSFVANGIVVHNTIPKHTKWAKKLRRGYIAPPGFKVVNWDFSQGELRIAACIANETRMIDLYAKGIDLHMVTGGEVRGYSLEAMLEMKEQAKTDEKMKKLFKEIRQGGKAGNFGLLYGMGANGFAEYAWYTYGVKLSLEEASAFRDKFLNVLYPGLVKWHKAQKRRASLHGYVRSPLGRVRHLPLINSPDNEARSKAERQSINSPVQATLSDLSIYSLSLFLENYGPQDTCRFNLFTHDSLTAYVREDRITDWVPKVQEIMENLPLHQVFGWNPQVDFISDAEVGDTLADCEDYDEWLESIAA